MAGGRQDSCSPPRPSPRTRRPAAPDCPAGVRRPRRPPRPPRAAAAAADPSGGLPAANIRRRRRRIGRCPAAARRPSRRTGSRSASAGTPAERSSASSSALIDSTPSHRFRQNVRWLAAPGNRHAMPMIAIAGTGAFRHLRLLPRLRAVRPAPASSRRRRRRFSPGKNAC